MCASRKPPKPASHGRMQLREIGGPYERIAIDIISGITKSKKGNTCALVAIDEFTKWVEVIPIPDQKAETVARALVNHVFYRHGIPRVIHSDQAKNLAIGHVMKNVCDLLGVSRSFSSAGHPEGNGNVERFNRFLVEGLYTLMSRKQDDWDEQLLPLLFAYRTSVHPTTGETPFFLMHGRDATLPGDLLLSRIPDKVLEGTESQKAYARGVAESLKEAYAKVKARMDVERDKQRRNYNRKHGKKDVEFLTGNNLQPADLVTIHYREPHVTGDSTKFRSTWSVPFRVVRRLENGVNYEVQNTRDPRVTRIVHVSRMKKFHPWDRFYDGVPGKHIGLADPMPGWTPDADAPPKITPAEDYEVEAIMDQYQEGKGRNRRIWYLIRWTGYPPEDDQWVESTKVDAIAVVKEWKRKVRDMTKERQAMFDVMPSERPGNFKRDRDPEADSDPEEISDGRSMTSAISTHEKRRKRRRRNVAKPKTAERNRG